MSGKNMIHMLQNSSHVQMESFIIEEEHGRLVVVDGGNAADAEHLLDELRQISGKEKPYVDAWFFSHAHDDHMDAFFALMDHHPDAFAFGEIYCCFPSIQYLAQEEPNAGAVTLRLFDQLRSRIGNRLVTVSEDDVYRFGTAKIQILYTPDCSIKKNVVNNSSIVFKLFLGSKTALFLNDLGAEGGEKLLASKAELLHADLCQMAHHGQCGVSERFYQAVRPEACLWCAPEWLWNNDRGNGFDSDIFETVTTRGWMERLGVKKHYCIKDGDQHIPC